MSDLISEKLACVPFSTEVIAIKGKDIHLSSGFLHGLRVGESLRVHNQTKTVSVANGSSQRADHWVTVKSVFPDHSIAVNSQETKGASRLAVGDVLRAW